jgi:hypothetical protein
VLGDAIVHFNSKDLIDLAARCGESITVEAGSSPLSPPTLLRALGYADCETLDINGRATWTHNLETPAPAELLGAYDLVWDAGVTFWCFDPAAALRTAYSMCAVGGALFHVYALTGHFGRGYFNLHPRWFQDFYAANGGGHLASSYRSKPDPSLRSRVVNRLKGGSKPSLDPGGSGTFYLQGVGQGGLEFGASQVPEPRWIPNNSVGNGLFLKLQGAAPRSPVQAL